MDTIIKLAPGNIGWFDPLTSIHLTLAKTEAIVKPGMNTTNIRLALADRKIILKQGTLEASRIIKEEVIQINTKEENVISTNIDTADIKKQKAVKASVDKVKKENKEKKKNQDKKSKTKNKNK